MGIRVCFLRVNNRTGLFIIIEEQETENEILFFKKFLCDDLLLK